MTRLDVFPKKLYRVVSLSRRYCVIAKKAFRTGGDQVFQVANAHLGPDFEFQGPYFPSLETFFLVVIILPSWYYEYCDGYVDDPILVYRVT